MSAKITHYKSGVRMDKSGAYVDVLAEDVSDVMSFVSGCTSTQISPTHWRLTFPKGVEVSHAKTLMRSFDDLSRRGQLS